MIDVAREAGVGKGTLYEYFSSKGDLLGSAFRLFMGDYVAYLQERIGDKSDPEIRLQRMIDVSISFFAERIDRVTVMFDAWGSSRSFRDSSGMTAEIVEAYSAVREELETLLREGVRTGKFIRMDYSLTASTILALIDGLLFQVVIGTLDLKTPRLAKRIGDTILKGIMK